MTAVVSAVADMEVFSEFPVRSNVKQSCVGHLGRRLGSSDTILKGDYQRTISAKYGCNRISGCRREDFLSKFPIGSYVRQRSTDAK